MFDTCKPNMFSHYGNMVEMTSRNMPLFPGSVSDCQVLYIPARWCRISSINSIKGFWIWNLSTKGINITIDDSTLLPVGYHWNDSIIIDHGGFWIAFNVEIHQHMQMIQLSMNHLNLSSLSLQSWYIYIYIYIHTVNSYRVAWQPIWIIPLIRIGSPMKSISSGQIKIAGWKSNNEEYDVP